LAVSVISDIQAIAHNTHGTLSLDANLLADSHDQSATLTEIRDLLKADPAAFAALTAAVQAQTVVIQKLIDLLDPTPIGVEVVTDPPTEH
jgi:hypothetical protein